MPTLDMQLMNALLDRYERSRGFVEKRSQQRRIQLQMYGGARTDFPFYDIEDSSQRSAVNEIAVNLAEQGVIELEWMQGQEGHILRRIVLRPEAVPDAYRISGRKPLADSVGQWEQRLLQAQQNACADWVQRYLCDQLDFLLGHRRLAAAFPADSVEQEGWLAVLAALGTLLPEHPVLERVFSLRCLGDSKAFEKHHRSRLLRVLQKYLPMDTEEMTEEALLRQVGLEKYPEWFSLFGDVRFEWPDGRNLDVAPLTDGLQISAADIPKAHICLGPQVSTLLFVENKANYYDTIRNHSSPEAVVVYHGGFYSPQRRRFFQQLCRAAGPHTQLLHWGDIDLGGFEMDSRLRREIDSRIHPWRMNVEQLRQYRKKAGTFSDEYAVKLEHLLQDPFLKDSQDVLLYMLQHRLRLEQEALIEG